MRKSETGASEPEHKPGKNSNALLFLPNTWCIKMPIATGLIIDTGDRLIPLNRDAYYCPVGMIGL